MTEKEAIQYLEIEKMCTEETSVGKIKKQMCEAAIKALEEVQEYRTLGKLEDLKDFLVVVSEDSTNAGEDGISLEFIKNLVELKRYKELGTLEEVQNAVELKKGKKPLIGADFMAGRDDEGEPIWEHDYVCPDCGLGISGEYICCPYCGTYIDWSGENE